METIYYRYLTPFLSPSPLPLPPSSPSPLLSDRTILSSLVIQDHYPATADLSVPTFTIHKSSTPQDAMKEQEKLLHIHKMTELARIMFTIEMMKIDASSVGLQQEVSIIWNQCL